MTLAKGSCRPGFEGSPWHFVELLRHGVDTVLATGFGVRSLRESKGKSNGEWLLKTCLPAAESSKYIASAKNKVLAPFVWSLCLDSICYRTSVPCSYN